MNTVLNIGDNYVASFNQLQNILSANLTPDMPEFDDILTLFFDGILVKWLEEGEDTEKDLANKIRGIDNSQSNRQIMEELLNILTDEDTPKPNFKPDINKYLTLKKVLCIIGSKQTDITEENKISIDSNSKDELLLKFVFSVDKVDNESFELYLTDNKKRIESIANVELKDYVTGSDKEFLFQLTSLDGEEHDLMLNYDDKTIYATHLSLYTKQDIVKDSSGNKNSETTSYSSINIDSSNDYESGCSYDPSDFGYDSLGSGRVG